MSEPSDPSLGAGDRVAGSLLGLALGDALGFVVEGAPPEQAAAYAQGELRWGRAGDRSRPPWPFGQYSDDTQLARELLRALRDAGGFDPRGFAMSLARLFEEGRAVAAGPASQAAARRLIAGAVWGEAAAPPPYAGNGAAMRAGPLGVLFAARPTVLLRVARDQGAVTHRDPRALAGAVAIAGAAALAASPGPINPAPFLGQLTRWVEGVDRSVAAAVAGISEWLPLPPKEAALRLRAAGLDPIAESTWAGISTFVTPGVAWSLYAFLRSPDSYWETVCTAIEVGGDTDTLAAMAGSISGARLGAAALPRDLLDRLTDAGRWGAAELASLARDCAAIVS